MANSSDIKKIALETLALESESIRNLSKVIDDNFINIVETLSKSTGKIILTGIGKSALIGMKISATLNSTGTKSSFLHLGDALHGDMGVIDKDDIIICISKSGESEEIKMLNKYINQSGNILIGISCKANSLLSNVSDMFILTEIEKEACHNNLAPTTSSSCHLAIGDAISMSLQYIKGFTPDDFSNFHPSGNLGKKLNLKAADLIDKDRVPSVSTESKIDEIINEISSKMYGATAVISNKKIVGIITDGDLRRTLEENVDIQTTLMREVMTKNCITVKPNLLAVKAVEIIQENKITSLVVVKENKIVGALNIHDLFRAGVM